MSELGHKRLSRARDNASAVRSIPEVSASDCRCWGLSRRRSRCADPPLVANIGNAGICHVRRYPTKAVLRSLESEGPDMIENGSSASMNTPASATKYSNPTAHLGETCGRRARRQYSSCMRKSRYTVLDSCNQRRSSGRSYGSCGDSPFGLRTAGDSLGGLGSRRWRCV